MKGNVVPSTTEAVQVALVGLWYFIVREFITFSYNVNYGSTGETDYRLWFPTKIHLCLAF